MEPTDQFPVAFPDVQTGIEEVYFAYEGVFDREAMANMADMVDQNFASDPVFYKRIFTVFHELVDNISVHSAQKKQSFKSEKNFGVGRMVVGKNGDVVKMFAGNFVSASQHEELKQKCETINELDRNGLRKFRQLLRSLPASKENCANIGMIQIALAADNPLRAGYQVINDKFSYFYIQVDLQA